jgi:hypothetical protein
MIPEVKKNMVNIRFIKELHPKKTSILFILVLIIFGLCAGIIVSTFSIDRANQRIIEIDPEAEIQPIFPFLGMTLITINITILIGLLYTNISIFRKTKSSFLIGLILFLFALLIKSLFAYVTIQSLTIVSAIQNNSPTILETLGFSVLGFGGILILYHMFEFFVLSIFFYVSRK